MGMLKDVNIAHLNTNADWGGGEYQVLHLLTGMTQRGLACRLYAHPDGALLRRARDRGLDTQAFTPAAGSRGFLRLLREQRPGLLHVHDSRAAGIGAPAARALDVPVILSRRIASPLRRNWISRRKYSPRNLAAVIAISETVRDVFLLSGFPPGRVQVVPSGLDLDELDALQPADSLPDGLDRGPVAVGIGRLSVKKNWILMVQVAAALREKQPDLQWVLAGDGPERERLERAAAGLGVQDRVHFLGFRVDAARLLKAGDLLFFPSMREGASVTVRQAMAMGIPVAAADAAGTLESLDGHGWVFGARDVDGAARRVLDVLSDETVRRKACDAARESARTRFDIRRTVEGTLEVYAGTLKG